MSVRSDLVVPLFNYPADEEEATVRSPLLISISTALLVGVPLPSAWLPAGTNTFASGK